MIDHRVFHDLACGYVLVMEEDDEGLVLCALVS